MLRVEKVRYNDGMKNAVMDIQVSTAEELPSLNDVVCGLKIIAGSIAQIIQADSPTFVTMDANGTWYPEQSDSSASSLNASLSMSAPKNLGSIRDEQPIEEIEEITEEPAEREEIPVKEQKKVFEESIEEPEKDGEDDDELL